MKGNLDAIRMLLRYAEQMQREDRQLHERFLEQMLTYKVKAEAELQQRQAKGITDMSDILPHPDHVDVDFATGELLISGPMSPREAEVIELAHAEWTMAKQAVAELDRRLASTRSPERRAFLLEARQKIEEQIRFLADLLGEPYP